MLYNRDMFGTHSNDANDKKDCILCRSILLLGIIILGVTIIYALAS